MIDSLHTLHTQHATRNTQQAFYDAVKPLLVKEQSPFGRYRQPTLQGIPGISSNTGHLHMGGNGRVVVSSPIRLQVLVGRVSARACPGGRAGEL